jgi:tetratricopeptide (TPR) repeat protein
MSAALDRKLQQAADALAAGDPARADRLLSEVLARLPRHPRALELAAAARLQQEDGAGACALFERALAGDPHNPRLLEGLGVAALKAGRPAEAEISLRRALALGRRGAEIQCWLGLALAAQEKHAEAAAAFREAAAADPRNPKLYLNLGHALERSGAHEDALAAYECALALAPQEAEALEGAGAALLELGRFEQAAERLERALALRPEAASALDRLGRALARQDKTGDALACLRRAVSLEPENPRYHADLADTCCMVERWEEAAAHYERALALDPGDHDALAHLGLAYLHLGKIEIAIATLREAIAARPDSALAHQYLGRALLRQAKEEEGIGCLREALRLEPGNAEAHASLGDALLQLGCYDEGLAHCEQAIRLAPPQAAADFQLGVASAHLFLGDFGAGWDANEQRLESRLFRRRYFRRSLESAALFERLARWRGPDENGAGEVALWAEQGIGDQVLFSTLLPELIATGVPFVYEVDRRLLGAYQRAFPQARFVALEDPPHEALQRASRVLAIGSLPRWFRRAREDFARQPLKLLAALPERVAHCRARLAALGPGPKIALAWRTMRNDLLGWRKTATLEELVPLLRVAGVRFLDVQYGDTAAERAALEVATGVQLARFEDVDHRDDLEALFAILEACDLVITTSNATAHFAGALGQRTWLLYLAARPPFHYWVPGEKGRSLWYPSVEIVTAPHLADWRALAEHAAEKLEAEAAANRESSIDSSVTRDS